MITRVRTGIAVMSVAVTAAAAVIAVTVPDAHASAPSPTWTQPTTLTADGRSDPTLDNDHIDVAVGSGGDAAVGWLAGMANGNGPGTVEAAYRAGNGGASWEPQAITTGAVAITEPRVAVGGSGDAVVTWEQADGLYAAYRPAGAGQNWTAPQEVAPSADYGQCGYDNCPLVGDSVAMDADGNAIVAWTLPTRSESGAYTPEVAYRAAGMDSDWSAPAPITLPSGTDGAWPPQIGIDAAGDALLLMAVCGGGCYTRGTWGIYYADRPHDVDAFGTNSFGAPQSMLDYTAGGSAGPTGLDLAVGADGSAAVSWAESGIGTYLVYRPAGQAAFDAGSADMYGTVSVDPDGAAFAVEEGHDYEHPAGRGPAWTEVDTGPFVPGARYSDQYVPADVALDSSGQAVVVGAHTDHATYQNGTVAAVRGTDGSWSTISDLASSSDPAGSQRVAADGQGDAIAAWVEATNGNDVIRVAGLLGKPSLRALHVPPLAIKGDPTTFSVDVRDVWHTVADSHVTWTFTNETDLADSVTDTGRSVSHAFSAVGTYDVSVTAVDSAGEHVSSPVTQVTVTVPDAELSADISSGTAPLTVHLDASGSAAPPDATFAFYCGDSDAPVAPPSSGTSATCTYQRQSPSGGWNAFVSMHDPATGRDYQATQPIDVAPRPATVDDSAAFDPADPVVSAPVAADGSLAGDTCGPSRPDSYCATVDGEMVTLTAAPGTFAAPATVEMYRSDNSTLQSELSSAVQAQDGLAVSWSPADAYRHGSVLVDITPVTPSGSALHRPARDSADAGGWLDGMATALASGAAQAVGTIGDAFASVGRAIGSWWQSVAQSFIRPNGSATNDVVQCDGKVHLPDNPSAADPVICDGSFTEISGVPSDRIAALGTGAGLYPIDGSRLVATRAGTLISDKGLGVVTRDGTSFSGPTVLTLISDKGLGLISDKGLGLISDKGLGFTGTGRADFLAVSDDHVTMAISGDPGLGFVTPAQHTPPTVTASIQQAPSSSGAYPGPVDVDITATPVDGDTVRNVSVQLSGAVESVPQTVSGDHLTLQLTHPGRTVVHYSAADDSLEESDQQSLTVWIAGVPGAPTHVRAGEVRAAAARLSWTAPVDDGGTPITGYDVQYSTDGKHGWTSASPASHASTAASFTVTGLRDGRRYRFRVAAINAQGTGGYSAASAPFTPRPDRTGMTATSRRSASYGARIAAHVRLRDRRTGKPLAGQPVTLYRRVHRGQPWARVRRLTTSSTGGAKVWLRMTSDAQYEYRYAGDELHAAAHSNIVTVLVSPVLAIHLARGKTRTSHAVRVWGTAQPGTARPKIALQRRAGRKWVDVATTSLSRRRLPNERVRTGYVFTVTPHGKGAHRYRVRTSATATLAPGTSPSISIGSG
jgi:hypothetical protein